MSKHRKKSTRTGGRGALTGVVALGVIAAGLPAAMQATAAPLEDGAAAAAGNTIKVVQHNTDQIEARWTRVLGKGDSNDLLLAEEVCQKWVEDARANPAYAGWKFSFHRQKRTTTDNALNVCPASADGSTWKGPVAVYTGTGASTTQDKLLDKSDGQRFGMACVTFTHAGRKVHGCATHLQVYHDKDLADRTRQTAAIKRITTPWIQEKGHSVIVGGDFNMTPSRSPMSNVYQTRGSGRFIEANQLRTGSDARAGEPTVFDEDGTGQRKIDYVFFSSNRTPLGSGGTLTVTPINEAHGILAATAHIR
ncbi:endonuclease/exonuclease/phosphatase family protein [Knoellia sp. CPCC 206453]|uniref:endonuclease/exonuclease/phosphatase family protein n=1 Tax=Knoellia pratensis TaxID=3404796 RepID=UPI003622350F